MRNINSKYIFIAISLTYDQRTAILNLLKISDKPSDQSLDMPLDKPSDKPSDKSMMRRVKESKVWLLLHLFG